MKIESLKQLVTDTEVNGQTNIATPSAPIVSFLGKVSLTEALLGHDAQPVLLGLQQLLVHSYLHVQGGLNLKQVLILLHLLLDLLQCLLDLVILVHELEKH